MAVRKTAIRTNSRPRQRRSAASVRPLNGGDLDRVIAIDKAITGRSRRGFYEKRFAAMRRDPRPFVALGAVAGGAVQGFILAHILDGEFGGTRPVAMLDALGVMPDARGAGLGHALMEGLDATLRAQGVPELRSQASWTDHGLVRLFAAAGFALAPRYILERPTHRPDHF